MTLPTTKVFILDFEGLGLESRWNPSLPIYFGCILTIDEQGKKKVHRHYGVTYAIEHARRLLEDGWTMIAHNAKFELAVMACRGFTHTIEKGILTVADTMVMEYIRNSGLPSYSLDALTGLKSDVVADAQAKGLLPEGVSKKDFWNTDWSNNPQMLAHIADYCVQDCKATWALYKRLCAWYNLPEHTRFVSSLLDLEFPMLSVLAHMEVGGIHISIDALESLTEDCRVSLDEHKRALDKVAQFLPQLQWDDSEDTYIPKSKVYKLKKFDPKKHREGVESDLYSTNTNAANVRHYLDRDGILKTSTPYIIGSHCELVPYNSAAATGHTYWLMSLQCPELLEKAERTPGGKPKLNKDFFTDVADEMPEDLPIAKFLKATKNLQMCISIAEHIRDGRIHGSFNNCLTRTGRLSSSDPNLQNVQRSDDNPASVGSRFRQLFTAPENKLILVADLDRIEIVVLAWFLLVAMKDPGLANVCNTPGADPHQANADRWKVARIIAKTLIFLLVYGGGAGLIFRRGMAPTQADAESMVKQVNDEQPSINQLKESVWATARKRGYVTNPFSARGVYPELYSKKRWERGAGERKAFNFLIQRTARDVLHTLVVQMFPIVLKYGARIVSIVHDEVIIECDAAVVEDLMRELQVIWGRRQDILKGVVINGDWFYGDNWFVAKG